MTTINKAYAFLFIITLAAGCQGELQSDDDDSQDTSVDLGSDQSGGETDMGTGNNGANNGSNNGGTDAGNEADIVEDQSEDLAVDRCAELNCDATEICDATNESCVCREGFIDNGTACVMAPAGDPATRTKADMCAKWTDGSTPRAASPWETDGLECGPGVMPRAAIDDTLRRINAYRWLSGLANVTDNPDQHDAQMECAAMMSKEGALSHTPGPNYACYTQAGAGSAGSSNIAYGYGSSAAAIDGYMDDGRVPSLGHRRWILNAPLARVGIGFSKSGNRPGQCLSVFDRSGTTDRDWTSFPNQGPTPMVIARYIWSFQHYGGGVGQNTSATVVRVSDGQTMPMMNEVLGGGGLPSTLKMTRDNWDVVADETYRVTITNLNGSDLTYEISPVNC